jgi:hypothetical protein
VGEKRRDLLVPDEEPVAVAEHRVEAGAKLALPLTRAPWTGQVLCSTSHGCLLVDVGPHT